MTKHDGQPPGNRPQAQDTPHTRVDLPDTACTAMAVIDRRGTVTGWSEGAWRLLGYEAAEVVGRSAAALLAEDLTATALRSLTELPRASGRAALRHRDGHRVEVGLLAHRRQVADGETDWLVVSPVAGRAAPDADAPLLEWAFAQGPCATGIYGSDLRLLRANKLMERAIGLTEAEMRGLRVSEMLLHPDLDQTDSCIGQVLESGRQQYRENVFRTPGDSREQAWAVAISPLRDEEGRIRAVCLAAHDETEQRGARQRLHRLHEAAARIGSTLDMERTARELVDVAVPRLADFAGVDLLASLDHGVEPPHGPLTGPVTLRHVAHGPATGDRPGTVPDVGAVATYAGDSPEAACLATGTTVRHGLTGSFRTALTVPMRARGATLGLAVFARHRLTEPFDETEVRLAEEITARAAACIDNARRYARERNTALTLQRSLLPQWLPRQSALEVATRYLPADPQYGVGGDWFDVIPLSGARVAMVVGDVVGHGVSASATMCRLRTAVRTLADVELPPDELLTHLDDVVSHLASDVDGPGPSDASAGNVGATCLYAVYDPVSRHCTLARAGHPLPAVVTPDGNADFLELPAGPPLGLGGLPFEALEVELPEGSLLALYTDGLIGARGQDIGTRLDTLREVLAAPVPSLEATCDDVVAALLPEAPRDDVALVIARTYALDAGQVATWDIPADPALVADARAQVSRQLADWGLEEQVFTTELVVSELVTNALRHAKPPIQLRLILPQPLGGLGGTLICEVSDASSTVPHLRRARTYDEGGRGLLLVAQLTQAWGTRHTATGKTIWAEQHLTADQEAPIGDLCVLTPA